MALLGGETFGVQMSLCVAILQGARLLGGKFGTRLLPSVSLWELMWCQHELLGWSPCMPPTGERVSMFPKSS